MTKFIQLILHAAVGGASAGLGAVAAGAPMNSRTVLYPVIGSIASSIFSLLSRLGSFADRKY
jgi:hypothetical protein